MFFLWGKAFGFQIVPRLAVEKGLCKKKCSYLGYSQLNDQDFNIVVKFCRLYRGSILHKIHKIQFSIRFNCLIGDQLQQLSKLTKPTSFFSQRYSINSSKSEICYFFFFNTHYCLIISGILYKIK